VDYAAVTEASPDDPAAHVVWVIVGVFGAFGFVVGMLVLRVGTGSGIKTHRYLDLSETQVHFALLAGQTAFWFIMSPLLLIWRRRLVARFNISMSLSWVIASIIALGAVILVPLHVASATKGAPIPGYSWRVGLLYLVALVLFIPSILLLDAIDTGSRDDQQRAGSRASVEEYFKLRAALRRVTTVLGVSVSLVIFATGAYINALHAYSDKFDSSRDVPSQAGLLVYGALFVAVLVVLFLPVYTSVRRRGDDIVDHWAALPDEHDVSNTNDRGLDVTLDKRETLRKALGLDESGRAVLERNLIVLSPLLSAAIATFLGTR
jgi:hypothetical protein